MKKKGLGHGVDILFKNSQTNPFKTVMNENGEYIIDIAVSNIVPNPSQPRREFDEEKIKALADSISELGLLQPVVVRKSNVGYELIAGERRWRAVKSLGNSTIKAIVKDVDEKTIAQLALIENLQREDLNPLDEALAYSNLIEEFDMRQEDLSKIAGKSRAHIANLLRILNMNELEKEAIKSGKMSLGQAKVLMSVKDESKRSEILKKIIENGITIREIQKIIDKKLSLQKNTKDKHKNLHNKSLDNIITDSLGTKAYVNGSENKGKIIIEYYTAEELERLIEILS